jgi:hypothetical protein
MKEEWNAFHLATNSNKTGHPSHAGTAPGDARATDRLRASWDETSATISAGGDLRRWVVAWVAQDGARGSSPSGSARGHVVQCCFSSSRKEFHACMRQNLSRGSMPACLAKPSQASDLCLQYGRSPARGRGSVVAGKQARHHVCDQQLHLERHWGCRHHAVSRLQGSGQCMPQEAALGGQRQSPAAATCTQDSHVDLTVAARTRTPMVTARRGVMVAEHGCDDGVRTFVWGGGVWFDVMRQRAGRVPTLIFPRDISVLWLW